MTTYKIIICIYVYVMKSLTDLVVMKYEQLYNLDYNDKYYNIKLYNINRKYNILISKYKTELIKKLNSI
jgi:hypothetical protein